jgi:hypothetical protein
MQHRMTLRDLRARLSWARDQVRYHLETIRLYERLLEQTERQADQTGEAAR